MRIKCCKDCNKRYIGCHSECNNYKKEREQLDKENKERRKSIYNNSSFHKKGFRFNKPDFK